MSLILLEEEVMGALFCSWQWQQCKESEQKHMVPAKPQAQNGVTVALTHNLLANTSYGGGLDGVRMKVHLSWSGGCSVTE